MKFLAPKLLALAAFAATASIGATEQAPDAPRQFTVVMDNMNFGSMPKDARVGDVIIWDNRDTVQHTATARDGSFDVRLQPGKKGRTVLRSEGNLAIYCIYHPMMRTTLRVAAQS
jgi:plastocyanin